MRVLIYGFGPYRQFRENVTGKILRAMPARRGVIKRVFPVRFSRRQFVLSLRRHRPDLVLGLGQCSRGRLLRQERRAVNRRRDGARAGAIAAGGAPYLPTDLRLSLPGSRTSCSAGDYVCNFSMYVMLQSIRKGGRPVRYGFVHVPHTYDPKKAAGELSRALRAVLVKKK